MNRRQLFGGLLAAPLAPMDFAEAKYKAFNGGGHQCSECRSVLVVEYDHYDPDDYPKLYCSGPCSLRGVRFRYPTIDLERI